MKPLPLILGALALGGLAALGFMAWRKKPAAGGFVVTEYAAQSAPVQAAITGNSSKPAGGWIGYISHGSAQYPKTQEEADRRMAAYYEDEARIASGKYTYDQRRSDHPVVLKSSIPKSAWGGT